MPYIEQEIADLTGAKNELLKLDSYFVYLYAQIGNDAYYTAALKVRGLADRIRNVAKE